MEKEKEHKKKEKKKREETKKKSRKYVHEILAGESDELRSVRVEKEDTDESSEEREEGGREIYRAVQGIFLLVFFISYGLCKVVVRYH